MEKLLTLHNFLFDEEHYLLSMVVPWAQRWLHLLRICLWPTWRADYLPALQQSHIYGGDISTASMLSEIRDKTNSMFALRGITEFLRPSSLWQNYFMWQGHFSRHNSHFGAREIFFRYSCTLNRQTTITICPWTGATRNTVQPWFPTARCWKDLFKRKRLHKEKQWLDILPAW